MPINKKKEDVPIIIWPIGCTDRPSVMRAKRKVHVPVRAIQGNSCCIFAWQSYFLWSQPCRQRSQQENLHKSHILHRLPHHHFSNNSVCFQSNSTGFHTKEKKVTVYPLLLVARFPQMWATAPSPVNILFVMSQKVPTPSSYLSQVSERHLFFSSFFQMGHFVVPTVIKAWKQFVNRRLQTEG